MHELTLSRPQRVFRIWTCDNGLKQQPRNHGLGRGNRGLFRVIRVNFLLIYSSFGILSILLTYDMPEKQGFKKNRLSSFFAAEFLVWKSTRNIVDAQ